jgi:hypothetical protein
MCSLVAVMRPTSSTDYEHATRRPLRPSRSREVAGAAQPRRLPQILRIIHRLLIQWNPPLSHRATNDDRPHDPHIPVKPAYLRYPLGARRADNPPKTVPVPRISRLMTTHRMHGPTPLAQRILAPMPQSPGTPLGRHYVAPAPTRTMRHQSPLGCRASPALAQRAAWRWGLGHRQVFEPASRSSSSAIRQRIWRRLCQ